MISGHLRFGKASTCNFIHNHIRLLDVNTPELPAHRKPPLGADAGRAIPRSQEALSECFPRHAAQLAEVHVAIVTSRCERRDGSYDHAESWSSRPRRQLAEPASRVVSSRAQLRSAALH